MSELETFKKTWKREHDKTMKLLQSLPRDRYDFRPDPDGRSLGELAWHLAEGEAYGTFGIEKGGFQGGTKPPGLDRPKKVEELAPAYDRIHRDAVARIDAISDADLDKQITFFTGNPIAVRDVLWDFMLLHGVHHRGQLTMLARQSGGVPSSSYGPGREAAPLKKPA